MATVIRFARHGTKKRPYFRIVVQDKTSPRDGRFIEHIGSFDPLRGIQSVTVARDRLDYWLSTGAQLSDSVKNRIKNAQKAGLPMTPPARPVKEPQPPKEA